MADSDIIHPKLSRTDGDGQFYEKWEDRKSRSAISRQVDEPVPKGVPWNKGKKITRRLKSGGVVDDDLRRRFKSLFLEGMTYKRITLELGISRVTAGRLRVAMKLPERKSNNPKNKRKEHQLHLMIDEEDYAKLSKLCHVRHKSIAAYVRELIRRDLGL